MLVAGMPSITLNEVARLRIEAISFFLFVFFVTPFAVRWLWNGLARDVAWMPKLGYVSALGVVTVWGLVFVVVLTMISGARELMTPGAWKPQGWTYKLDNGPEPDPSAQERHAVEKIREQKLALLRAALWQYAETHAMTFPPDREATGVASAVWETPDQLGLRYVYHAGHTPDQSPERIVACEPGTAGDERYVLFTSGAIRKLPLAEIQKLLGE